MLGLRSKLATLRWYAARPALYREAARRLLRGQVSTTASDRRRQQQREDGQAWCRSAATDPAELFATLGVPPVPRPVSTLHSAVWDAALAEVARCPVPMGGPANVDVVHHLVRNLSCKRVLETGVASGWSSLAILLALPDTDESQLISIDMPYAKRNNEAYVGCAVPSHLRNRWTLVRRSDRDALEPALAQLRGQLDLAHYDSDKSDAGRSFAYPRLWQALRSGGVLMSDDIEDTLTFRDFSLEVGRRAWVLEKKPGNYAGILVK